MNIIVALCIQYNLSQFCWNDVQEEKKVEEEEEEEDMEFDLFGWSCKTQMGAAPTKKGA